MIKFTFKTCLSLITIFNYFIVTAQITNPTPFDLTSGNYSFTEWNQESPAGTYPANTVIHRSTGLDPSLTTFNPANDYVLGYNLTSGTRVVGEGEDGLSFINTGTAGNLGALVLALNTIGRGDITIGFTAGLIAQSTGNPSRNYALRLQYKIGNSDIWLNLDTPPEYSSVGQIAGHEQIFSDILLPTECNDQELVQLRWLYYQINSDGTGNRPRIRLDDISVASDIYVCQSPTIGASSIIIGDIGASTANISWTNGNGSKRIVILRANQAVEDLPLTGEDFIANANFGEAESALGSGFVVYNGNESSVNVTGLTLGVTYHLAVIEYTCNPTLYLNSQVLTGEFTTVAVPELLVSPLTSINLTAIQSVPGVAQTVSVSGSFLTGDVNISSTEFFEISLSATTGFSNSIVLTPVSGTVISTNIFVRFFPTSSENQSGTLTFNTQGANIVNISLIGTVLASGSLPTAFQLCNGAYNFNSWPADAAAGTYPANMIFHRMSSNDPGLTATDVADYVDVYNASSQTRINGLGAEGFSFINTGTAGNLGAAVVGLNTVGRNNINVSFLVGMMTQGAGSPLPREYRLRLQYRVGTGAWTDFSEPVEYSSLGLTNGHIQNFSDILLPGECNNQEAVYLRWFYYQFAANDGGSRPRIRLNNINVTSSSSFAAKSDVVADDESFANFIPSTTVDEIETIEDGELVWAFTIRDGGADGDIDELPLLISRFSILQGEDNEVNNWSSAIAFAALFEGETKVADANIEADKIVFSELGLNISDDSLRTFSLRIALSKEGLLVDGSSLQFKLNQSSFEIADACNSSVFAEFEIQSPANENVIDVEATQIIYTQVPESVILNQTFSATVSVIDDYDNVDRTSRNVTLSFETNGTGILTSATGLGPQALENGTFTWNDLIYNVAEFFELIATSDDDDELVTSEEIECIDPVGIFDISNENRLVVFPNPSLDGQIYFNQTVEGILTDISGRTVAELRSVDKYDASELPKGIYFLRSHNASFKVVLK
jgi:hypothetical protein